jgi:hypothetical protein
MTIPVKTFIAKVKDRLDWPYPNALVAIHNASVSSQNTYTSNDCKGDYETESIVDTIAYHANFWGTKEMQQSGVQSRPLINMDDNSDLFIVDLEHAQSIQVLNGTLSPMEKDFLLMELDVKRRFA